MKKMLRKICRGMKKRKADFNGQFLYRSVDDGGNFPVMKY